MNTTFTIKWFITGHNLQFFSNHILFYTSFFQLLSDSPRETGSEASDFVRICICVCICVCVFTSKTSACSCACTAASSSSFPSIGTCELVMTVELSECLRRNRSSNSACPSNRSCPAPPSSSRRPDFPSLTNSGLSVGKHALTIPNNASTVDQIQLGPSSAYS